MSDELGRAAHYDAHKDDEDEWGEPEPVPKARRRLASMISVRLSPKEADVVRAAAQQQGVSVSAFLRRAALLAAMPTQPSGVPSTTMPQSRSSVEPQLRVIRAPDDVDIAHIGNVAAHGHWQQQA
jgi:mobilization protein NikA